VEIVKKSDNTDGAHGYNPLRLASDRSSGNIFRNGNRSILTAPSHQLQDKQAKSFCLFWPIWEIVWSCFRILFLQ
jgi:hypothetical protein